MRASAFCCLLSCLASSALAVHRPLRRHRHDRGKRTEVLEVEKDLIVKDIDVKIYLPGPPPEGHERFQEGWEQGHYHEEWPLTTYTLPDGSATVVSGPEPTYSGSGYDAGEAPPSNPIATSSAASDSGPDSGSGSSSDSSTSLLGGGGGSSTPAILPATSSVPLQHIEPINAPSPVAKYTASASVAADSPAMTTTPASSVVPANDPPAMTSTPASSVVPADDSKASITASSAAAPSHTGPYPFSALVVFGDNLSDNGNGSVAHNVAANSPTDVVDGNTVYGAGTWTDGPVAVSFLTDLLGVPMTQNFAFGHAWGGSHFGATIDDTMQQSNFSASLADGPWFNHGEFSEPCWGAPSGRVQINDYIAGGVNKDALHTVWFGANDMDAAWGGTLAVDDPALNAAFAANISIKIPRLVSTLLDAGAPYVLVANLYNKNHAPLWPNWLNINTTAEWDALGTVIQSANTALAAALQTIPNADRVIYYDAYAFMADLYANPGDAFPNIRDTNGWPSFCDGDKEETPFVLSINGTVVDGREITANWDYCFWLGHGAEWYWMQYLDPTSHVHQLVALDMEQTIKKFPFPSS